MSLIFSEIFTSTGGTPDNGPVRPIDIMRAIDEICERKAREMAYEMKQLVRRHGLLNQTAPDAWRPAIDRAHLHDTEKII